MGIDIRKVNNPTEYSRKLNTSNQFLNKEVSLFKKLGAKDKASIYKDLSVLLKAGVDFKSSLDIIGNQQKKQYLKDLFKTIREEVIKGKSFYEALENSGYFSPYEFYSVKIGEETKKLDVVLLELHRYYKRQVKLKKQIISVITYPAFVLLLTIGVLYFMLTYVVPMFTSVFNQFDSELPELTKNIIILSEIFPSIILVAVLIFVISFAFFRIYKDNVVFRSYKSKIILRIPYFGILIKKIYLARYCQFLDLLLTSKTSLTVSLDLVKKTIEFYPIESSIDVIKQDIVRGLSFAKAMQKHKIFEYKLVSMVEVAEEINELDSMFSRLADEYDEEVEHRTKMIGIILEPVIIISIGLIVGVIMIAMYAPMFDLSKVINGS